MFQLIVAVIAIALVIALTLASIFYGGEAFTRSSLKANVAALVNQAQQISGAHTLYKTDTAKNAAAGTAGVEELVAEGYLSDVPTPPKIVLEELGAPSDRAQWELEFASQAGEKDYVTVALPTDAVDYDPIAKAVTDNGAGSTTNDGTDARFQFPL